MIYISTDADPQTGEPLISSADDKRHRELFRGETADGGATWSWTPITANSTMDNLRPIVPKWNDPRTALVWMRGNYRNNHGEWTTAVVATILTGKVEAIAIVLSNVSVGHSPAGSSSWGQLWVCLSREADDRGGRRSGRMEYA